MASTSARKNLDWRKYLTEDERQLIKSSDLLSEAIAKMKQTHERRYGRQRRLIVNRAVKRAQQAAREA